MLRHDGIGPWMLLEDRSTRWRMYESNTTFIFWNISGHTTGSVTHTSSNLHVNPTFLIKARPCFAFFYQHHLHIRPLRVSALSRADLQRCPVYATLDLIRLEIMCQAKIEEKGRTLPSI